jgi:hypothetical protein
MAETEEAFMREITDFLKKDLGVRVPITASQITYHSPEIVAATCDYTDIHAYWQHPRFPRKPWDPVDWDMRNTPMEQVPDADALLSRAPWRLLDRPFTMSEWNIPDPHDYAASVVPFAALVAALQDWDGVFFFQYQRRRRRLVYRQACSASSPSTASPPSWRCSPPSPHLYRRGDIAPLTAVAAGHAAEAAARHRSACHAPPRDRPAGHQAPPRRRRRPANASPRPTAAPSGTPRLRPRPRRRQHVPPRVPPGASLAGKPATSAA